MALAGGDRPLSRWYADPLDRKHAWTLLEQSQSTLRAALRGQRPCVTRRLQGIIARHSLGRPIDQDYGLLRKLTVGTAHGQALTELIYGQLLMSRKLSGAMEHLSRGFEVARNLLDAEDFFIVRKRHKLLGRLALGYRVLPPATLEELLAEAAVIRQLKWSAGIFPRPTGQHTDTLG